MTFAWSKTVEEKARAFCKELTGSEDEWEEHVSAAVNSEFKDALSKSKAEGGHYKLKESTGEPYRAGTQYGEWQWWRPIETAPKDETLLGWIPRYGYCLMHWKEDQLRWSGLEGQHFPATFWMPLPEPPDDN
jgi:hypothetical protein